MPLPIIPTAQHLTLTQLVILVSAMGGKRTLRLGVLQTTHVKDTSLGCAQESEIRPFSSVGVVLTERRIELPLAVQWSFAVDQHSSPLARQVHYRRGLVYSGGKTEWQELWHFDEKCESYPTRTFVVRTERPLEENLCVQCRAASRLTPPINRPSFTHGATTSTFDDSTSLCGSQWPAGENQT